MNILQQSFQQSLGNNRGELDEMGDQYFDEAKHKMMKDLVDFNSREDFEMYMRGLERNYFDQLNFPKAPYDVFPDYPPKPYQAASSKVICVLMIVEKQLRETQKKDYIDRFNEMNTKRLQAYSYQPPPFSDPSLPPANPMLDYLYSVQAPLQNLNQTPFFSSIKNGYVSIISKTFSEGIQFATKYTPIGQPNTAIPGGPSIGMLGQIMEPPKVAAPPQPPYMQRFVAGPSRLESNPLSEPMRSFKNPSGQSQQQQMTLNDYNLANPDVQFERYKQLMQSQYYNNNANSNTINSMQQRQQNCYRPPPTFAPPEPIFPPKEQYGLTFNPSLPPPSLPPPAPTDFSQVYPLDLYNRPNSSISLYNQQVLQQVQPPPFPPIPGTMIPGYEAFHPDVYKGLQTNNIVDKGLIDSLGGIENTIKPIENSLKTHELRPYQVQKDYQKELKYSQKGYRPSANQYKPENLKLVSVSPYRAIVKYDNYRPYPQEDQDREKGEDQDEMEEQEAEDGQALANNIDLYNQIKGRQHSPIRGDSEQLREQRENYLKNFNEQKEILSKPFNYQDLSGYSQQEGQIPNSKSHQRQYRKMKNHSEYLRNQREGFLNFFADQRVQNGGEEGYFQQENM